MTGVESPDHEATMVFGPGEDLRRNVLTEIRVNEMFKLERNPGIFAQCREWPLKH